MGMSLNSQTASHAKQCFGLLAVVGSCDGDMAKVAGVALDNLPRLACLVLWHLLLSRPVKVSKATLASTATNRTTGYTEP